MMKSTFASEDCIYLLKDLTGIMPFISFEDKERNISKGVNYSEMITEEAPLSKEINEIFKKMIVSQAPNLAGLVASLDEQIYNRSGESTILVSLARAGSPVGALLKRYFYYKYKIDAPHYSISIIRDRGIDVNALDYIVRSHPHGIITFIDGWTGKGSITSELKKAITDYNKSRGTNISADLGVLADPAHLSAIAGTRKDVCIPNACLNATVSGLVSRTILNTHYIGANDFHGAVRFDRLQDEDLSNYFLDIIESAFENANMPNDIDSDESCIPMLLDKLKKDFPIAEINKVKLSIGESSRAMLRRIPYMMLVKDINNPDLAFVLHMARLKGVEVRQYDTMQYECITLLK